MLITNYLLDESLLIHSKERALENPEERCKQAQQHRQACGQGRNLGSCFSFPPVILVLDAVWSDHRVGKGIEGIENALEHC